MTSTIATSAGRIILGLFFLAAGAGKVFSAAPAATVAQMSDAGVPAAALMFALAGACEVIGGLSLAIGLHTRLVAALLAAFCFGVSFVMHAFWSMEQGPEQVTQMIMFLKNFAIGGGLLAFVGQGAGPASVDRLLGH